MNRKIILQLIFSTFILFICFNNNFFKTARPDAFRIFQNDSESLIAGRILKSDREGISSSSGLLGWNHPAPKLCDTTKWQNGIPPYNRFKGWGYPVANYPDKFAFQFE